LVVADLLKMLRSGELDTEGLTSDQVQELIGEMAEEARSWVPLCPNFPELKGVSCEAVEAYREEKRKRQEWCGPIYGIAADRMKQQMDLPLEILKMEYEAEVEGKDIKRKKGESAIDAWIRREIGFNIEISPSRSPEVHWPDRETEDKMIEAGWPQDGVPESAYANLKAMMIHRLDPVFRELRNEVDEARRQGVTCHLGMSITGGDPRMAYLGDRYDSMETGLLELKKDLYDRDYFNNLKVFTRDDLYDVAVELGKQLSGGYDLIAETYRYWLMERTWPRPMEAVQKARPEMLRRWMSNDEDWQSVGRHSSNHIREKFVKEHGIDDVLSDPHTVFVTTPRGGFEFLSVFAYANDLKKSQLPTEILTTWEMEVVNVMEGGKPGWEVPMNEIFGYTWLGDVSMPVKRVVIVDDIIESGDQQYRTRNALRERMGPDVEVLNVVACGRRWPHATEYNRMFWNPEVKDYVECRPDVPGEYASPCEEGLVNVFQFAKYGYEILELKDWRERMDA